MVHEVVAAVTGGKLDFGPWEQIFYGEYDSMLDKRVQVKVIGGIAGRRIARYGQ